MPLESLQPDARPSVKNIGETPPESIELIDFDVEKDIPKQIWEEIHYKLCINIRRARNVENWNEDLDLYQSSNAQEFISLMGDLARIKMISPKRARYMFERESTFLGPTLYKEINKDWIKQSMLEYFSSDHEDPPRNFDLYINLFINTIYLFPEIKSELEKKVNLDQIKIYQFKKLKNKINKSEKWNSYDYKYILNLKILNSQEFENYKPLNSFRNYLIEEIKKSIDYIKTPPDDILTLKLLYPNNIPDWLEEDNLWEKHIKEIPKKDEYFPFQLNWFLIFKALSSGNIQMEDGELVFTKRTAKLRQLSIPPKPQTKEF